MKKKKGGIPVKNRLDPAFEWSIALHNRIRGNESITSDLRQMYDRFKREKIDNGLELRKFFVDYRPVRAICGLYPLCFYAMETAGYPDYKLEEKFGCKTFDFRKKVQKILFINS